MLLFHHALGLTPGVLNFAASLRAAGHPVDTPDLYNGRTFPDIASGVVHAEEIGFEAVADRGVAAATGFDENLVYAGFSLGVLPAQKLAQSRPGARGALFYHAAVPPAMFGTPWPPGVPLQIHLMADDEWAREDAEAAQALVQEAGAELFVYPGSSHLFAEPGLPDYDPAAAALLLQRTLAFLPRLR